jgi:hypothetical protein
MRTLLLAGVAALSVLTASAAHADATLSPTDPLIGSWCDVKDSKLLKRGTCDTTIDRTGYGGVEDSCTFLEIKKIPNGIEAFSKCSADSLDKPLYYEKVTFQIIDKFLKIETLKEYTFKVTQIDTGDTHDNMCVEVQPTPDGYLNLRQGPGMNFKVKAKLLSGQRILVDVQTAEWTHVRRICDEKEDLEGWVYTKYIKDTALRDTSTVDVPSENSVSSPLRDEIQEDWCRRNDPNFTAQSCIELKNKKPWPKWLLSR